MATRITHVHLEGGNQHEHITAVKWRQDVGGNTGQSSKSQMVKYIEDGNNVYVSDGQTRATVGVVKPKYGEPYLRTYADGKWTNNLLALPRF
jgi:pyruvate kinase